MLTVHRWHDGERYVTTIARPGRTKLHLLVIDTTVRVISRPLREQRYLQPLLLKGQPYPVRRAVRRFRDAGRTLGITEAAKEMLKLALQQE